MKILYLLTIVLLIIFSCSNEKKTGVYQRIKQLEYSRSKDTSAFNQIIPGSNDQIIEHLNTDATQIILSFEGWEDNCIYGNYKFLYLSPERLQQDLVQQRIQQMPVNLKDIKKRTLSRGCAFDQENI